MKLFLSLLVLSFLFFKPLQAQKEERLDSLFNVYENQPDGIKKIETLDQLYHGIFQLRKPEDVLPYVKEQLQLSKTFNYIKGEGDALFNYGNYYRRIYTFDSAHYYFEQAASIWEELDDNEGK